MNKAKEGFQVGDIVTRITEEAIFMPIGFVTKILKIYNSVYIQVLDSKGQLSDRVSYRFRKATPEEIQEYYAKNEVSLSNIIL